MLAHINKFGNEQSVKEHLEATAKLCRKAGEEIHIGNMAALAGLMHDLGKNKKAFNNYLIDVTKDPSSHKPGEVDHSTFGGQYIFKNYHRKDNYTAMTAELIAEAVFSHHGIIDMVDAEGDEKFLRRAEKVGIDYDEVLNNSKDIFEEYDINALMHKAVEELKDVFLHMKSFLRQNEQLKTDNLFYFLGCLQRLLTSLVIDADRQDTAEFMTGVKACRKDNDFYKKLWIDYQAKLDSRLSEFKNDDKITLLRKQMSKECFEFAKNPGGIYTLAIPTGGGKTLASLRYALEHSKIYGKKKIVYVAPYLSILEQNAKEIKGILKDSENVLEHHSNIVFENKNEDENEEERNSYKYLSESWSSPVILTSMVRLLETLFAGDTASVRRFGKLINSVIIIDEIQNLPIKTVNLFNMTANFLAYICGCTIVLCSATQPCLDEAEKKIVYGCPKSIISKGDELSELFRRVRIADKTKLSKYSTEELADFILEKAENNMLVILNTKNAVKTLYNELKKRECGYEIYQLTTYMCPQHRNDVIEKIKSELGNKRLICISTQLIEAGVDISFENVVRSMAGLDSIIQAAGRCNRHGTGGIREVYIINFNEENVSQLEDIKAGQDKMLELLLEYKKNYDKFGADYLLNNDAIYNYYQRYFFKRKDEMSYNADMGLNKTLYQALSKNKSTELHRKNPNGTVFTQAYKSAGDKFNVIDSNTIGIVVPYKEGKEKTERLLNTKDFGEIKAILKDLQRYTVNVYENKLKELTERNAVIPCFDKSLYILSDGFYDEETGLSEELKNCII